MYKKTYINGIHNYKNMRKNGAGFTLIEMIVAGAIFCIIIVVILGIFISSIRIQRYNLASQQLMAQTSYAMEYMSRFIRMAKKELADGTQDCLSADGLNYEKDKNVDILDVGTVNVKILFKDYNKKCRGFFVESGQLKEYEKGRTPSEVLPLTSNKLEIKTFEVVLVGGSQSSDTLQPKITILLEAEVKNLTPTPRIKIQTTVSQRDLDVSE